MSAQVYKAYGKWILTGEHAVLRGAPALVFPLYNYFMEFQYTPSSEPIKIDIEGTEKKGMTLLLWGVLEVAIDKVQKERSDLKGHLLINGQIPFGTGLGASATLCVCVAKWFVGLGWLGSSDIYHFARSLEDLFHGESSGVDIAAALSDKGVIFHRESSERQNIDMKWQPNWYLSYCGSRGVTSECIQQVKKIEKTSEQLFKKIDAQMAESSQLAMEALMSSKDQGQELLIKAMDRARDCFNQWNLAGGMVDQHMRLLLDNGALAVKPTGSGGGGYILSLWAEKPQNSLSIEFIDLNKH